jgi:uncharacterized membrane protein
MKFTERWILFAAIASIAVVGSFYALKFLSFGLSPDPGSWAALGEYFGGILSPILSFFLILLVINEAMDSRRSYLESKQLQLKSQQQVDEQIQLLRPHPELVYYLSAKGSTVFVVVENIGNATAYDVQLTFEFEGELEQYPTHVYERFKSYHYFPPKYKTSMFVSHVAINHEIIGIPPHTATIKYSDSPDSKEEPEKKMYYVDTAMLQTIHCEPDFEDLLNNIVSELRRPSRNSTI